MKRWNIGEAFSRQAVENCLFVHRLLYAVRLLDMRFLDCLHRPVSVAGVVSDDVHSPEPAGAKDLLESEVGVRDPGSRGEGVLRNDGGRNGRNLLIKNDGNVGGGSLFSRSDYARSGTK